MSTIKNIWTTEYDETSYIDSFCNHKDITLEDFQRFERIYADELTGYANLENIRYLESIYADIFQHELMGHKKTYVVKADIGLWDGRYEGGKIIEGMESVIHTCMEDITAIYLENRLMRIDANHHDGINLFSIKELTPEGERFYEKNIDKLSVCQMVNILFNDRHKSRHVRIWNKMDGL